MKSTALIAGALIALVSTATLAQEMSRDQLNQRPSQMQQVQPGVSPGKNMNDSAQGGVPSGTAGSGTLMQQREKGMAPDATQAPAKGANSTGTMKQ
ncbi:hypothetical protein [Caballeronia sp. GAFFF2]|uniref:hypothetical protein n=1 Tax=Caballeronia sp. GAFFF2 TaxID=2921741 RepID=UPI002028E778|nr:hypothetical protein [Caballeronia sp. GAFFF2]